MMRRIEGITLGPLLKPTGGVGSRWFMGSIILLPYRARCNPVNYKSRFSRGSLILLFYYMLEYRVLVRIW